MYRPLVPCPACARHVLATERACPFCAAATPADLAARVRPEVKARMSRSAMAALGAALALSACSSTVASGDGSAPNDSPAADATPDAPRPDVPAADAPRADVVDDDGGPVALYGDPPPRDAGVDVVDDDGGPVAEYGAPPPQDAGTQDVEPRDADIALYGAPPPPRDAGADGDVPVAPLYGAPADLMV
ncbi:MAG: hypothetical protein U0324_38990 [Polyangiales bacterium]